MCSLRHLFLRGARHVQLDPVRGGRVDVSGELRTVCAAGLLALGDGEAIAVLVDHLADAEGPVRRAAAQNLARSGHLAAPLLLRLKARLGDVEPDLQGEVLRALLAADPGAVDVVAPWLASPDEAVLAEAALALAETRAAGALAALRDAYATTFDAERRRILLASIGMLRSEEACTFLLDVVQEGAAGTACDAMEGLRPFAYDDSCRQRAATLVEARDRGRGAAGLRRRVRISVNRRPPGPGTRRRPPGRRDPASRVPRA